MRSVCSILLLKLLIVFCARPVYALPEYDIVSPDHNMGIHADVQKVNRLSERCEVFVMALPKQVFEWLCNNVDEIYCRDGINQDNDLDALLHEALRTDTILTCKRECSPGDMFPWDVVVSMIDSGKDTNVNLGNWTIVDMRTLTISRGESGDEYP